MALEIERKFLVERMPPDLQVGSEVEIAQGYLAFGGDSQVRLRRQGDITLLTAKRGHGMTRQEVEVVLEPEPFNELWPLTKGRRLEKSRLTSMLGDRTIEIDVYKGGLAGLIVAEVEFDDADSARAFSPPSWFARELTGDPHYSNQRLAVEGLPAQQGG